LKYNQLKYNQLLTNAVAIQNVIDLTRAVRGLLAEGYVVKHEDLATLSPYQTRHIKRFGDYVFTVTAPEPFDGELATLVPDDTTSLQVATAQAACGLFLRVSPLHPVKPGRSHMQSDRKRRLVGAQTPTSTTCS